MSEYTDDELESRVRGEEIEWAEQQLEERIEELQDALLKADEGLEFYADKDKNTQEDEDNYGWNEDWMGCETWRHDNGDTAKDARQEIKHIVDKVRSEK